MATPFLNLQLPTVSVTLGPTWASQVNAAFEVIDSHDHSSGKGVRIPTAGLNINAALDFNNHAALDLEFTNFRSRTASPSGSGFASSLSVFNGNLYYTNSSGIPIQVTSGGSIVSSPGTFQSFETTSITSDLTISPSDTFVYIIVDTTATREITLPLASAVSAGRVYIIKDASGQSFDNNITITPSGSDQIDGASSRSVGSEYASWMLVNDGGTNWYIS